MAKKKFAEFKITDPTELQQELVEVIFIKDFEGNLNNFHISQKPNTKLLVTKLVYDFLKKHKAIE